MEKREYSPLDNQSRLAQLQQVRSTYACNFMDYTNTVEGRALTKVNTIYNEYLHKVLKPEDSKVCDTNGELDPTILLGIHEYSSNEIVTQKLSTLADHLSKSYDESVVVPVTDEMPQSLLHMREIFSTFDDISVIRAWKLGTIEGWRKTLDLVDHEELPLLLYPKSLANNLERQCRAKNNGGKGIVLSTRFEGVKAYYQYAHEFSLPYISLLVEPQKSIISS